MDRERYIQVEGNSGLVRDRTTGAILNVNSTEIQKARLRKKKEKQQELEIQELKKDVSEINKIAGGRVWIGTDALQIDIIDELGDIEDAIGKAAALAEISEYQLKYSSSDVSFVETVLSEIFGKLSLPLEKIKFVKASESIYKFLTELAPLNKPAASMICKVCIVETS